MVSNKNMRMKSLFEEEEFKNDTSIGKYVRILRLAYENNKWEFSKLTKIEGEKRQFIFKPSGGSKSRMKSRPRKIKETPYHVITRINNMTKKKVIKEAMDMLGYSEEVASMAAGQID